MRKALALQHRGDWYALRDLLQSLSYDGDPESAHEHSDAELLQYQSGWRTGVSVESVLPALLRCVSSPQATINHRLEAGIIALTYCDNDRRRDLADAFFHALSPFLSQGGLTLQEQLTLLVIYHCSFGSMDEAEQSAQQLVKVAREQRQAARRVRGLMIAGTGLREVGKESEAEHAMFEAHAMAREADMQSAAANSASSIAALMVQRGDRARAYEWLDAAELFGSRSGDATVQANIVGLKLRLRLQEADHNDLEHLANTYSGNATTARLQCLSELIHARIAIRLGGDSPTDFLISRLYELHAVLRGSCSSDLSAIAISEAFERRGEHAAAAEFVKHYVRSERRTRCTLAIELREPWKARSDTESKKEPSRLS
jgi:hypothetical protein